jgi:hypothetical protein
MLPVEYGWHGIFNPALAQRLFSSSSSPANARAASSSLFGRLAVHQQGGLFSSIVDSSTTTFLDIRRSWAVRTWCQSAIVPESNAVRVRRFCAPKPFWQWPSVPQDGFPARHLPWPTAWLYCLTSAFLGSVRIWTSASSVSSAKAATTGMRPTSSGIRPNLIRSSGSTSLKHIGQAALLLALDVAPKPMPEDSVRFSITFSKPANAPPQMNRMLVVSICRNPGSGACAHPGAARWPSCLQSASARPAAHLHPDTSRVMDGLSDLREILSISSM